jgi:hypothetical protein
VETSEIAPLQRKRSGGAMKLPSRVDRRYEIVLSGNNIRVFSVGKKGPGGMSTRIMTGYKKYASFDDAAMNAFSMAKRFGDKTKVYVLSPREESTYVVMGNNIVKFDTKKLLRRISWVVKK